MKGVESFDKLRIRGWKVERLGDVCEIFAGGDVSKVSFSKTKTEKYTVPIFTNGEKDKGLYGYTNAARVTVPSITISARGTIGYSEIREEGFYPAIRLIVLTPNNESLELHFLQYAIKSLDFTHTGTSIPQLTVPMVSDYSIPIPPLPEQQRIVAVLHEAFASIAQAKVNAERNLSNARELFESVSHNIFTKLITSWGEKKLGELCEKITKGSSPNWQGIKYVDKPGILFITSENVGRHEIILDKKKYVEEKFNISDKKSILQKGDVLTNIVGASIGRTAIFSLDDLSNINQAVCILRCKDDVLNNSYLTYLLNSPFFLEILHDNEVDNARANLSLGFFSNLAIPVPPLTEQRAIVDRLDALSAETKRLEGLYQRKLEALEELKKSLLARAFAGEL